MAGKEEADSSPPFPQEARDWVRNDNSGVGGHVAETVGRSLPRERERRARRRAVMQALGFATTAAPAK